MVLRRPDVRMLLKLTKLHQRSVHDNKLQTGDVHLGVRNKTGSTFGRKLWPEGMFPVPVWTRDACSCSLTPPYPGALSLCSLLYQQHMCSPSV